MIQYEIYLSWNLPRDAVDVRAIVTACESCCESGKCSLVGSPTFGIFIFFALAILRSLCNSFLDFLSSFAVFAAANGSSIALPSLLTSTNHSFCSMALLCL